MKFFILIFILIHSISPAYSADNTADTAENKLQTKYNAVMGTISGDENKYSFFYSFVKTKLFIHQENETISADEIYEKLLDIIDSQTAAMIISKSDDIRLDERYSALYDLLFKNEYGTNLAYQHDADKKRLMDLKYYGLLIVGYHEKTGVYPLQKKAKKKLENYVYIGTRDQAEFFSKSNYPKLYNIFKYQDFVKDIESVMKIKVQPSYDPQNVPVNAPVVYIYMLKDDNFYFSVNLFDGGKFAKKIEDGYYKLQISNIEDINEGIWRYDTLFANGEFLDRMNDIYIWIPPKNSY